uniref:Uncharacterized protein n=1 Tax=Anguilla anguilla TaxID=7936 RepID=A0A0E9WS84_ANGAN
MLPRSKIDYVPYLSNHWFSFYFVPMTCLPCVLTGSALVILIMERIPVIHPFLHNNGLATDYFLCSCRSNTGPTCAISMATVLLELPHIVAQ